ncbi:Ionotropic receptor 104, partial [Halyomorpha halys]
MEWLPLQQRSSVAESENTAKPVSMNITFMVQAYFALNNTQFPEIPPQILRLLGHSVIVSPEALRYLRNVDHPHILAYYGNLVENELTGAVIAGHGRHLFEQMSFLYSQRGWMERAIIILISKYPQQIFFSRNWDRRVMNIIQFTGEELYAYNPFRTSVVKLELEDAWKTMTERWRDLQGYKIPITVFPHMYSYLRQFGPSPGGGIDGTAIFELAKRWNMTVVLKHVIGDEYGPTRANVLLFRGQALICMSTRVAIHMTDDENNLEFTTAAAEDAFVVALKEPTDLSTGQIIIKIFGLKFWMLFFGTMFIINRALFWMTKQKCVFETICNTTSSLCGRPLPKLPRTTRERLILYSGFIIGFIVLTTFQASLFHFVKTTETNKRLKTLHEVFKNHNKLVTTSKVIKKYFEYFSPIANRHKRPNRVAIKDEWFEKYPVIIPLKELQLLMSTSQLRKDLYVIDEKITNFPLMYSVKRGSPFLIPLTRFATRVFEGGLSQKWFDMTVHRLSKQRRKNSKKVDRHRNPGIEAAFWVLMI